MSQMLSWLGVYVLEEEGLSVRLESLTVSFPLGQNMCLARPRVSEGGTLKGVQGEGYRGHAADAYQRLRGGTLLFPMCLYHL